MKKTTYILENKKMRKVILEKDLRKNESVWSHWTEWEKELEDKEINKILENGYYGQKVFTQEEIEKEYIEVGMNFTTALVEINNIYY